MKVKIHSLDGAATAEVELPPVFATPVRPDLIKRAVIAAQSARLQSYGPGPLSGKQTSAESIGKGRGSARVRRTKSGRHVGAFVPQAVGGRPAHPPKVEGRRLKKINDKERNLAVRSAIAATSSIDLVRARGHMVDGLTVPIIVSDDFQSLSKASEVKHALVKLGLGDEIERVSNGIGERAGRGKMRGRKRRVPTGPLCVIEAESPVRKAASNLPGLEVTRADALNAEVLAPGGVAGRISVWTAAALNRIGEIYG